MRRSHRANRFLLWLGMATTAMAGGCGDATDDLPRQAVSGDVQLDSAPLKSAMIQFLPADPNVATAGGAAVVDGKYAIPTADGLVPGSYMVEVTSASTAQPKAQMPGDPLPPAKEAIPSIYNSKTTLNAKVTKEGPNTFNFELKSK